MQRIECEFRGVSAVLYQVTSRLFSKQKHVDLQVRNNNMLSAPVIRDDVISDTEEKMQTSFVYITTRLSRQIAVVQMFEQVNGQWP